MAVDFPSNPTLNQTYQVGNYTWQWNGVAWQNISSTFGPTGPQGPAGSSAAFTLAPTPPTSNTPGDRWVNTLNGVEYTYTYDGNSYQWIQLNSGLRGPQGDAGAKGDVTITGQYDGGIPASIYGGVTAIDAGSVI